MSTISLGFHDVNDAYTELMKLTSFHCLDEKTRNGPAKVFQAPVLVSHFMPYRRVLFDPIRNANPFFHYMEAIWMLAGSEDVRFPVQFAKQIKEYSDDGVTLNGAYGFRWKYHWDKDQIEEIVHLLRREPSTRRAVLTMWDPQHDLGSPSRDIPCNTHIYFRQIGQVLDMTVCNRSNDLVWGMLGANIVHMSILQEYIASCIQAIPGTYYQFTNNLHVYGDWVYKYSPHPSQWYRVNPQFNRWTFSPSTLDIEEAIRFVEDGLDTDEPYRSRILRDNAEPMLKAWLDYKDGDYARALHFASKIYDEDWREGCRLWITRRMEK